MQLLLPRRQQSSASLPAVCLTARLVRRCVTNAPPTVSSACYACPCDLMRQCSSSCHPLFVSKHAVPLQALRQQMDILQAQLSALQALQTSAPQPSLPAHLQTQPTSSASRDQPASAALAASEADVPPATAADTASATAGEPPSMPSAGADSLAGASGSGTASQVPATSAVAAEESPEEQMRKQRLQRFAASE